MVISKKLSICPEYNLMVVRDAELPKDEEAARAAANRSGLDVAAASREAVYISATQKIIPVRLEAKAYGRPRAAEDRSGWDGAFTFEIDFPTGYVHFGDTFHRADGFELPAGPGPYAVTVLHAGRAAAFQALREVDELQDSDRQHRIEQSVDVERYLVVLSPAGH